MSSSEQTHRISLPAEHLFDIGPVPVTNGILAAFLLTAVLAALAWKIRRGAGIVPSRPQTLAEAAIGLVVGTLETAFGSAEKARQFLPLMATLFIAIVAANQMFALPLALQFVYHVKEGTVPLLRLPTADLSMTLALALLVVVTSHLMALRIAPLKHISHYVRLGPLMAARSPAQFGNAFLELFLGLLETIGELAKVISLSCRLFGNIFAGEVMTVVIIGISAFTQFIVPIPFIFLGLFVGFVQAYVFMLLATQLIAGTVRAVEAHH